MVNPAIASTLKNGYNHPQRRLSLETIMTTKKERLNIDRELARLKLKVGGLTNVTRMPDALFIWDIGHEKTAMIEAQKKNIPIIAVCDTNSNPSGINYVIPSNDDATKTIKLLLNAVCEAVLEGKKERASASATVVEKK